MICSDCLGRIKTHDRVSLVSRTVHGHAVRVMVHKAKSKCAKNLRKYRRA